MKCYHGTESWNTLNLADGKSTEFGGLYVTDTRKRAQLYAEARASRVVETELRNNVSGSAVVELETEENIQWRRRANDHNTLDKCEQTINSWSIVKVTVYVNEYSRSHGVAKINGRSQNIVECLEKAFGDKLEIITVN